MDENTHTNNRDSIDTNELLRDSSEIDSKSEQKSDATMNSSSSTRSSTSTADQDEPNGEQVVFQDEKSSPNQADCQVVEVYKSNGDDTGNQSDWKYNKDEDVDFVETADLMHLEPKLREAWIKMRRLDKVLVKLCKKEKLVKLETMALIEKNRAELELLRLTADHKETKQEAQNTAQFLALSYVDLDDEFRNDYLAIDADLSSMTPVFKTQLPDAPSTPTKSAEVSSSSSSSPSMSGSSSMNHKSSPQSMPSHQHAKTASHASTGGSSMKSKSNASSQKVRDKTKDFIKRNIKLAQDAAGVLAMTDEERERLNELLTDLEQFDKSKETAEELELVEYNPLAVKLAEGDGFMPERSESERLKKINADLDRRNSFRPTITTSTSSLLPLNSSNGHRSETSSQADSAEVYSTLSNIEIRQIKLNDDFDENEFGDKFIREARVTREQENRLKLIEAQLERMKMMSSQSASSQSMSAAASTTSKNTMDSNHSVDQSANSSSRNDMDSDMETIKQSSASTSIITKDQLKLLLEECELENNRFQNFDNLNKLDTLREESYVDEERGDSDSQTVSNASDDGSVLKRRPNATIINSLLEQAKEEGIMINEADYYRNQNSSPERSFYNEALEIISSRQNADLNAYLAGMSEQTVPNVNNDLTFSDTDEYYIRNTALPPLVTNTSLHLRKTSVDKLNGRYDFVDESCRSLNLSRSSTTSSSLNSNAILPKIESSRALPHE